MTKGSAAQEPSMEEILASIRRIISDEEALEADAAATDPDSAAPDSAGSAPETSSPDASQTISEEELEQLFGGGEGAADEMPDSGEAGDEDDADGPAPTPDIAAESDQPAEAGIEEDILELSEDQALEGEPGLVEVDESLELVAKPEAGEEPETVPEEAPAAAAPTSPPPSFDYAEEPVEGEHLLSRETDNAVSVAFQDLATTILSNNARTLEDLVREMLRPMLKSWLDENLPSLVERLVRAEIERVSRGGHR